MIDTAREFLRTRQQAYRRVFAGEPAKKVLADLAKFCRANESTFHTDPRVEGVLQGRREVWLRVSQHLNLTEDELQVLYNPNGD